MPTNPYATFLGDRNAKEVIAATPERLQKLISTLGAARTSQPSAPGKWSAREIACHLADCEIVFAFRLRQGLAEDHHVVQPFDQDKFAQNYGAYDANAALAVFSSVRRWNVAFVNSLPASALQKKITHPERGDMTLQTIVDTMAGHDLNHLRQVEAIAAKSQPA